MHSLTMNSHDRNKNKLTFAMNEYINKCFR